MGMTEGQLCKATEGAHQRLRGALKAFNEVGPCRLVLMPETQADRTEALYLAGLPCSLCGLRHLGDCNPGDVVYAFEKRNEDLRTRLKEADAILDKIFKGARRVDVLDRIARYINPEAGL